MADIVNSKLYMGPIYAHLAFRKGKQSNKHKLCCTIVDFAWCISTCFKPIRKLTTRDTMFLRLRQRQVVSNSLQFQYIRFRSRAYTIHCLQCKSNLKQICKLTHKQDLAIAQFLANSIGIRPIIHPMRSIYIKVTGLWQFYLMY